MAARVVSIQVSCYELQINGKSKVMKLCFYLSLHKFFNNIFIPQSLDLIETKLLLFFFG